MFKIILPLITTLLISSAALGFSQPVANSTGLILDAINIEHSMNFTDLYMIKTTSKNRRIVIYCNSSYCYKQRITSQNA